VAAIYYSLLFAEGMMDIGAIFVLTGVLILSIAFILTIKEN